MKRSVQFVFSIFCIVTASNCFSQDYIRVGAAGSTVSDFIEGYSIDPQGNLVICGTFQREIDLNFEPGLQNLMSATSEQDIYVAKYDITGNHIWSFHLGGDDDEHNFVKDIATDTEGNIFITGFSDGWIDFDPSEVTDSIKDGTESMFFLAKYNSDGEYLWAHGFGNDAMAGSMIGWGLALDSVDGSIYLLGQINDDVDLDPSAETAILSTDRHSDMFLVRYSNDGAYLGASLFTYPGEYGTGGPEKVRVDAERNVYICGYYNGIFDMDPSGEVHSIGASENYDYNGFLAKYNEAGQYQWAISLGSDMSDYVRNIRILDGNLYAVGDFMDTVDFDPSEASYELQSIAMESSGYLAVYDTDGVFRSAMGIAGQQIELNYSGSNMWDVNMDKLGDIYLTGSFFGSADFDPSEETALMSSTGGISDYDMYVAKYDSDINYQWSFHVGGNSQDRGFFVCPTDGGELIAMGYFDGYCDFDPSVEEEWISNNGGHDIFLAWYLAFSTAGIGDDPVSDRGKIRIYPNPVQDNLNIASDRLIDRIGIYSLDGKLIQSHKLNKSAAVINLQELPPGIYLISLHQSDNTQFRKFLKVE